MFGKRCQLCGGKLSGSICQECGLDNSKNDSQYEKYFGTSQCDEGPLTHVHEEKKPKKEKTQKKISFHRSQSDKTSEKSYTQSNSGTYTDYTDSYASADSQSGTGYTDTGKYGTGKGYTDASNYETGSKYTGTSERNRSGSGYGYTATVGEKFPRKKKVRKAGNGIKLKKILGFLVFVLIAFEVLSDVGSDLWKDSTSVFSSKEDSADSDGAYDYVTRELSEDGDSWEETLGSGEYVVGVQIPEGIYTLEVDSGSDTFNLSDYENGIYLWRQFALEDTDEDTVTSLEDVRLYNGAVVRLDGGKIRFTTDCAQSLDNGEDNPLTEEVTLTGQNALVAGVDFPAGVYDVETTDEGAYLDFEVPVADGEEYADYYISSVYLEREYDEDIAFKNLVIPEGVKVSLDGSGEDLQVILKPSERIESTDYEAYYKMR